MDILNEKIEGLVKKAEKSNMILNILKKVYDRGMDQRGEQDTDLITTPQQWYHDQSKFIRYKIIRYMG